MRKFLVLTLATVSIAALGGYARADQKVAILALSADADSAKQVEFGLRDQYANVHVETLSVHEKFPLPLTVPQIAAQLLAQGFTELLCVAPSPAINLQDTSAAPNPVMQDCLTIYSSGTYSTSGDALNVNPTTRNLTLGSMKNTGQSRYQVQKGLIQLFTITTGQQVWQGTAYLKIPEDLRTSERIPRIVKAIWQEVVKAGFGSQP